MSDTTLDQMLTDETIGDETTEESAVEESTTETTEESEKDGESTGDKDSTPESDNKASEEPEKEEQMVPVAALVAEREKRQKAEQELAQEKPKEEKPEPTKIPSIYDDPEGYQAYMDQKIADAEFQSRISVSQALMRQKHKDYDEKEVRFVEMAKEDPSLGVQLRRQGLPAEFVYDTVVKRDKLKGFDNFDDAVNDAVSKKTAEIEKSLREKFEKEYKDKFGKIAGLPPSGALGSSVADETKSVKQTPLNDILGNQK
jgi:hypothetical protein